MEKDFLRWHELKTDLQKGVGNLLFQERDIWLCSFGLNLGHEEDGKGDFFLRPVVVFRKINTDTFWAIPLTGNGRSGSYYYSFDFKGQVSVAILSQIRLLDQRRLLRKMGTISEIDFVCMVEKFKALLPMGLLQNEIPS
jgi:mRNA interferase MazF